MLLLIMTVDEYTVSLLKIFGINRLQVFKYFEDNNILLHIETFYDEESRIAGGDTSPTSNSFK